tara:strand:+ start:734 stop:1030 length:297 start_codon:yes stop_codon:yes gene_type:complete
MRENPAINAFKVWIFPSLASAMALLIWNDVNEIKSDVKQLMAQSNVDKTRIDNLERVVYKTAASFPANIPATPVVLDHVAILPEKLMIKQIKNEKVLL